LQERHYGPRIDPQAGPQGPTTGVGMIQDSDRAARLRCRIAPVAALLLALPAALLPVGPAAAQGIPLIRDTEIEDLLNDYARPVFRAAGLGTGRVAMRIVKSDAFNAFVVDGRNVFIHTGTLMQSDTPNQVIGVIAHEAGHIAGGHMAALRARIAKDQTRALLMQALGIGLMIAGGVAGGDNRGEFGAAGQGVMMGGTEVVMRSLLAERRSQESAADQAGVRYLEATRQSGRGMLETFERFAQQEYLSDAHKDVFVRSHPVATDRLARLRDLVRASPSYEIKDNAQLQLRHDLMRAKLSGYLERPSVVLNRYPPGNASLPARYARAIATFFRGGQGALPAAMAEVDVLIKERPDYPYFVELKADLLMRSGKSAEAVPLLRQALKMKPDASLVRVQLATALQGSDAPAAIGESVDLLRKSLIEDENPRAYNLLGNAYGKQGKVPQADAAIAQARFLEGDVKSAQIFAKRAQKGLTPGTPDWIKTDDIIKFKPET
jgi:predicted Zn-dependent protease